MRVPSMPFIILSFFEQPPHPLSQVYSFVPIPGAQQHKRPRRRYEEIERMYKCGWQGCEKAYGTLNHLNAHVTMQSHGQKRTPEGMFTYVGLFVANTRFGLDRKESRICGSASASETAKLHLWRRHYIACSLTLPTPKFFSRFATLLQQHQLTPDCRI